LQGGQWMLNLVDHFGGTFLVFALVRINYIKVYVNFLLLMNFVLGYSRNVGHILGIWSRKFLR
jgi:hypothetical protein